MLPQGAIWQLLRQQALATIPSNVRFPYATPPTFAWWLSNGAFVVSSTTKRHFLLSTAPQEIGGVLLSEAAYHLDHASEHSVIVRNQLLPGRWYSAAWLCVTFYYWSFFLALSITRMIGKTGLFLKKVQTDALHRLSNAAGPSPGAGPFILECGLPISASQIGVTLRKAKSTRLHDLAWRLLFEKIDEYVTATQNMNGNQLEARLFEAILRSARILGDAWPSDLRNLVNYVPGRGYSSVRREPGVGIFGSIAIDPPETFDIALNRLENNVTALSTRSDISSNAPTATKVLVDVTFALDSLARALHQDVVDRRRLDRRWMDARIRFMGDAFITYANREWPYAD